MIRKTRIIRETQKNNFINSSINDNNAIFPYIENQTYFLEGDGSFYQDLKDKRFLLGNIKELIESRDIPGLDWNNFKGNIILDRVEEGEIINYHLYYIDRDGNKIPISFEGLTIDGSEINLEGYLKTITFEAHPSYPITEQNITDWTTAFNQRGSNIDGDGLTWNNNNLNVDTSVVRTTGNQNIGGIKTFNNAQGTVPFAVSSTTKINNLNASLLDGKLPDSAATNNTIALRDANGYLYANRYYIGTTRKDANWDTAYDERGSQIAGDNLNWNNGNLNLDTTINGNHSIIGDFAVQGNLTVTGTEFITNVEELKVENNLILINEGLDPLASPIGFSGIEVNRGNEDNFFFGIDEQTGYADFRVGKTGELQPLLTRDEKENLTTNTLLRWNNNKATGTSVYWDSVNSRLGIGVSSPAESLDVSGKIKVGTQATNATDAVRADRTIGAGNGLTGGGALTSNVTITMGTPGTIDGNSTNNVTTTSHTHELGTITFNDTDFADQALLKTSDVVFNTIDATNEDWDAAFAHISNDGTDHTFIDQDLRKTAEVEFSGLKVINGTASEGTRHVSLVRTGPGSNIPQIIKLAKYDESNRILRGRISGSRSTGSSATNTFIFDVAYGPRGATTNGILSFTTLSSWGGTGDSIKPILFIHEEIQWIGIEIDVGTSHQYPTRWHFDGYLSTNIDYEVIAKSNASSIINYNTPSNAGSILYGQNIRTLFDLAVDGSITSGTWNADIISVDYGGTGQTTFTSGRLLFGNGTNAINTDANIHWDNTNKRLGIGTVAPNSELHVVGNADFEGNIKVGNSNTLSNEGFELNGTASVGLRATNTHGYVSLTPLNTGWAHIYTDRSNFIFNKDVYTVTNRFSSYNNDLQLRRNGTTKLTLGESLATFADSITLTGASTISTTTGNLGIQTNGGNGDINLNTNGTGEVNINADTNVQKQLMIGRLIIEDTAPADPNNGYIDIKIVS